MSKNYRQGRIGEEIRRIISEMLLSDLKDPRLDSMISITDVEVTKDNSYATVYFSPLGVNGTDEEIAAHQEEVLEAFNSAKGFIRNRIGHEMKLRHTPELIFKVDHSMEISRHIEDIIRTL
ncbi:MAG: 30S ribosome-binding factor RbfA [Clostridiales bacterium]|jgi:ribosome-binding factor A|nr:30S ribosome-binding factor RbfA [Clostridiales bacterium]MBQ3322998.1 30S ribosome-binding factor RbfA [Bacillota bacterium]